MHPKSSLTIKDRSSETLLLSATPSLHSLPLKKLPTFLTPQNFDHLLDTNLQHHELINQS